MSSPLADEIIALLEPLAEHHGLELVTAETAGGRGAMTVRVFLDREGGIDIDAIAAANEWISDALDGVRTLSGPYTLEVSSPGIDRVLRTRRDYERFSGKRAAIHTARPIDGRSRFTGVLAGIDGDDVRMIIDGNDHLIPFGDIERARLKADLGEPGEGSGTLG